MRNSNLHWPTGSPRNSTMYVMAREAGSPAVDFFGVRDEGGLAVATIQGVSASRRSRRGVARVTGRHQHERDRGDHHGDAAAHVDDVVPLAQSRTSPRNETSITTTTDCDGTFFRSCSSRTSNQDGSAASAPRNSAPRPSATM